MISAFEVFNKISVDDNKNLKFFSINDNFKSAKSGKNGWGSIEIAVDNASVVNLMEEVPMVGGLLIVPKEDYEAALGTMKEVDFKLIYKTINQLSKMIYSGMSHDDESIDMVKQALSEIPSKYKGE